MGRNRGNGPTPAWYCKFCTNKGGFRFWNHGTEDFCKGGCKLKKVSCHHSNRAPATVSTNMQQRAARAEQTNAWRQGGPSLAEKEKEKKAKLLEQENEKLKLQLKQQLQATAKPDTAAAVFDVDAMDEDPPQQQEFDFTIQELRDLVDHLRKTGKPDSHPLVSQFLRQIEVQVRARDDAKPPDTKIKQVTWEIGNLEKKAAKLRASTAGLLEAVLAAQKRVDDHNTELARMESQIDAARTHRAALIAHYPLPPATTTHLPFRTDLPTSPLVIR